MGSRQDKNSYAAAKIPERLHGERLDHALELVMPRTTLIERRRMWERGWIMVDGYAREKSYRVRAGQEVDVLPFDPELAPPEKNGLRVVKADTQMAALYKPAGMPCDRDGMKATVAGMLEEFFPGDETRILNWLEPPASGLVLVALDRRSADRYMTMDSKNVSCVYFALVEGNPDHKFTIKNLLEPGDIGPPRIASKNSPTFLRWTIVTSLSYLPDHGATFVKAHTHKAAPYQVRAHLACAGTPVKGDSVYGPGSGRQLYLHLHSIRLPNFSAECDPDWPDVPLYLGK
jgi:23S rRNA pseudouridine1911/1915/1917 synthase